MSFSVCVYCGSRPGSSSEFADVANRVGRWIGSHGCRLVYGGGSNGLMGMVANSTLAAGGKVFGVIPKALITKENGHRGITELKVVDTMHQRKQAMAEASDVFVALPGGIGTFEELFEVWTWRQLGYHDKPIGLVNVAGYYDGLLQFARHCVDCGFMNQHQFDYLTIGADPEKVLDQLLELAPHATAPDIYTDI